MSSCQGLIIVQQYPLTICIAVDKYPVNTTLRGVSQTHITFHVTVLSYCLFVAPAPIVCATELNALLPAQLSPPNPQPGQTQQKGKCQNHCNKRPFPMLYRQCHYQSMLCLPMLPSIYGAYLTCLMIGWNPEYHWNSSKLTSPCVNVAWSPQSDHVNCTFAKE